jgi:5-methylcytosine-specific restriction endonuclease McrA
MGRGASRAVTAAASSAAALQKVRARRIRAAGGRCQRCGRGGVALVLHHLGELDDYGSTLVLCKHCHRREHRTMSSH